MAYCWLSFGSEARREQTLRTDQDNGLVFADAPADLRDRAAHYYLRLGEETVRRPRAHWRAALPRRHHGFEPDVVPAAVGLARILSAVAHRSNPRPGARRVDPLRSAAAGGREPSWERRSPPWCSGKAPGQRGFLRLLASDVVERRTPLTLLGRIATRRTGPHRGAVDLKGGGTMQLVGAARVHALELGLSATNTVDRFRAAQGRGLYAPEESREIVDAAQHLMRLRLVHQLDQDARGESPDNFVVPAQLSHADRVLLREALRTVGHVQATLRERFATDFAPR